MPNMTASQIIEDYIRKSFGDPLRPQLKAVLGSIENINDLTLLHKTHNQCITILNEIENAISSKKILRVIFSLLMQSAIIFGPALIVDIFVHTINSIFKPDAPKFLNLNHYHITFFSTLSLLFVATAPVGPYLREAPMELSTMRCRVNQILDKIKERISALENNNQQQNMHLHQK